MASELFEISSLLLSALFAISASAQLNDSDWYLWLPLYSLACLVIPADPSTLSKSKQIMRRTVASLGLFLFFKAVIESRRYSSAAGFWSLDMREHVVRKKLGSFLVVISMFLHQTAAANQRFVDYGMGMLVGIAFGLSFIFLAFHKEEMKNDVISFSGEYWTRI